jgi:hypothetical protein
VVSKRCKGEKRERDARESERETQERERRVSCGSDPMFVRVCVLPCVREMRERMSERNGQSERHTEPSAREGQKISEISEI